MILLISYALVDTKARASKQDVIADILKSADEWWHHLPYTWIIETSDGIEEWRKRLLPCFYKNEHLLMIGVNDNFDGKLPVPAWKWLESKKKNKKLLGDA